MLKLNENRAMVAVKRAEAIKETDGGIALPEAAQETPHEGTVIHASPQSVFSVGDLVVFGRYAGTEIDDEGVKLILLNDDSILCSRVAV